MAAYELIVFDWDGTLMDSRAQIVSCMRQALQETGLPDMPDKELQQVIGLGLKEAVQQLLPRQSNDIVETVSNAYRKRWLTSPPGLSDFFIGIPSLLQKLHGSSLRMAVATGKSRRGLDKQLHETDTGHLFVTSRCADETQSKPAPDMLLEILDETGCSPEHVLVVGDTAFDMQMAQSANVDRLAVTYGVHDMEQLAPYDPVAIVESASELYEWFEINIFRINTPSQ